MFYEAILTGSHSYFPFTSSSQNIISFNFRFLALSWGRDLFFFPWTGDFWRLLREIFWMLLCALTVVITACCVRRAWRSPWRSVSSWAPTACCPPASSARMSNCCGCSRTTIWGRTTWTGEAFTNTGPEFSGPGAPFKPKTYIMSIPKDLFPSHFSLALFHGFFCNVHSDLKTTNFSALCETLRAHSFEYYVINLPSTNIWVLALWSK